MKSWKWKFRELIRNCWSSNVALARGTKHNMLGFGTWSHMRRVPPTRPPFVLENEKCRDELIELEEEEHTSQLTGPVFKRIVRFAQTALEMGRGLSSSRSC